MRELVFAYVKKKYKISPEYPWAKYDSNAVFRHSDNKKWFALVMSVEKDKLGLSDFGYVDVINLKIDDIMFRDILIQKEGILPAYHMNKQHWITVLLDGTVDAAEVYDLIDSSFIATASKKKKEKIRPPKEWLIPANPKFYDIEHAFDNEEIIKWKQSSSIKVGDTIFIYVTAPVSAILYKCKAVEVDIPYNYEDKNLTITTVMKIKLLRKYDYGQFTFDILKEEYGIYAVRGPRGVPNSLSHKLKEVK
ncbi:MAG: MmcQ/YjbR family DNA-binding protein [Lachnospiraceae bacterium]|nr:MmcQ/YjbR family DNA-binding protein [Lachnospiraceae bacterium]